MLMVEYFKNDRKRYTRHFWQCGFLGLTFRIGYFSDYWYFLGDMRALLYVRTERSGIDFGVFDAGVAVMRNGRHFYSAAIILIPRPRFMQKDFPVEERMDP